MKFICKIICCFLIFTVNGAVSQFIPITFPDSHPIPQPSIRSGSSCRQSNGIRGSCQPLSRCETIFQKIIDGGVKLEDVQCRETAKGRGSHVCCPKGVDNVDSITDISPPKGIEGCGMPWWDYDFTDIRNIYLGNYTMEEFIKRGFKVTVRDMFHDNVNIFDYTNGSHSGVWNLKQLEENRYHTTVNHLSNDHVISFDYFNFTHNGTWNFEEFIEKGFTFTIDPFIFEEALTSGDWNFERYVPHFAVGGVDAPRELAVYMALLGNSDKWFCDGALVNSQWVLTAAHCFDSESPTIVRLGEYDYSDDRLTSDEVPLDYSLSEVVIYPEYRFPSSYHDLALVKLNKSIPHLRPDIGPVCLPWGKESSKDLVGEIVTLTGWGATAFWGPNSPTLQVVNVTVFDPSVCDKSYSKLSNYRDEFPNGIHRGVSVCAGDEQGGKDACQGDSGGPIVYLTDSDQYTLAGIVSTGNGCGLKEFPGIYAPLHIPQYLAWIKKVAFS